MIIISEIVKSRANEYFNNLKKSSFSPLPVYEKFHDRHASPQSPGKVKFIRPLLYAYTFCYVSIAMPGEIGYIEAKDISDISKL